MNRTSRPPLRRHQGHLLLAGHSGGGDGVRNEKNKHHIVVVIVFFIRMMMMMMTVLHFVPVVSAFTPSALPIGHLGVARMAFGRRAIKTETFMATTTTKPKSNDMDIADDDDSSSTAMTANDNTNNENIDYNYTLEYSINFHRHIVWKNYNNGTSSTVMQSFAFIDEALEQYPTAQRLPLRQYYQHSLSSSLPEKQPEHYFMIAGSGLWEQEAYPPPPPQSLSSSSSFSQKHHQENVQQIKSYLETKLKWFPNQVQELFLACPSLTATSTCCYWPIEVLKERLDFLTSPLPSNDIVTQVNHSMIDWPVQFYRYGYGAGMSIAQLSYALSLVPNIFLRLNWMNSNDDCRSDIFSSSSMAGALEEQETIILSSASRQLQQVSSSSLRMVKKFSMLYAQTPPLVLELARKQLDALHGASHLDCVAFSYLHWKGWDFHQMRIVIQALPTVLTCSIQPSWELYERGGGGSSSSGANGRTCSVGVRKQLIPESLAYLCYRLQIGPNHILAMLKTHARLSGYKVHSLRRNVNLLQESLHLPSSQLRSLILRLPSLLGMSQTSIEHRLDFWTNHVGLDAASSQLKVAVLKQPSLLQYGVDTNLVPKLNFFRQELGFSAKELRSLTVAHPQLWGRSLDGHLRPLATNFAMYMNKQDDSSNIIIDTLSLHDFGQIVKQAPEIALCSWKGNLQDKLDFLHTDAGLDRDELKVALLRSPRILLHSLQTSLRPRLYFLQEQEAAASNAKAAPPRRSLVRQAIRRNPSLLLNSMTILKKRFNGKEENNGNVWDDDYGGRVEDSKEYDFLATAVKRRQLQEEEQRDDINKSPSRRRRGKRTVQFLLLSSGKDSDWIVQEEFDSVKAASEHANVSESHMYLMLRQDRPLKSGIHKYAYMRVNPTVGIADKSLSSTKARVISSKTSVNVSDTEETMPEIIDTTRMSTKVAVAPSSSKRMSDLLAKDLLRHLVLQEEAFRHLTMYTSGRAYPPEVGVRGQRRSGGMALQAPSWTAREWKAVVQDLWQPPQDTSALGGSGMFPGRQYHHPHKRRLLRDGKTLILGYAFTRPSRNRCSLYACLEALRVARAWQRRKQKEHQAQWQAVAENPSSCRCSSCCDIEIITDSNYCLGWLENTTRLYEWGSAPSKEDFCNQWTTMSMTRSTPSRLINTMTSANTNTTTILPSQQQQPLPPLHQANPDILYPLAKAFYQWMKENNSSDHTIQVKFRKENYRRLGEAAHLASQLMYDTAK